jgi:DNA-binding CsgD family transcriptional regulator/tetratricopeptide (TPR) repeat protein
MSSVEKTSAIDPRGQRANEQVRAPLSAFDLLERDDELAVIDALISAAPTGGRLLVIEGPFGIGKTSLVGEAKTRAREAGFRVLGARGSELERTFAYGVVRQLFEPLLVGAPPDGRAELLAGAAALAIPLFEPAELLAEPTADALALLHGLYWLTVNATASGPLLLAIDDLHWCDLASLRWLAYLLPRMEGLPVLTVVGVREGEPGEAPGALARIVSDPLATVTSPTPLSSGAVGRLLRETVSPDADHVFIAACHEQTGGNPQLVRDFAHAITAEDLAPTAANVPRLRELGGRAGARALAVRLSRLPPAATRLAQAVAILGDDADLRHAATLAGLDDEDASEAAAELVRADILRFQPEVGFVHPVIRAAVYEALTHAECERGHARAVGLLADSGAEPERIAAHVLRIAAAADAGVVQVLREAARNALARGAPESAVAYLRRALDEPREDERVDVLLELGSTETLVTGPASVEHLREAHRLIDDPVRRAETAFLLGRQLFLLHEPDESDAVLQRALDELGSTEAELGRRLEAALIHNAMMEPHLYARAAERLERIRPQPADATTGEKMLLGLLAYHDARANVPAEAAVALARGALAGEILLEATKGAGPFISATMVLALADQDEALQMWERALADAHRLGSIFAYAVAKIFRTQALLYRGELIEAEGDGREALEACEVWGLTLAAGYLTGYLAGALIEQGKLDVAKDVLARGGFEDDWATAHAHWFLDSRVRLRLASGEPRLGLEEALAAGRSFEAVGGRNPAFLPWRSQAALAYLQLGETTEARRLAAEELDLARTWGAPRALGASLRVAGLAEGGQRGLALLEEAVAVVKDSPAKLEHAKARTELGAALRRANRRTEAREHLRPALELATICGAASLADRAQTELLATGARPRRISLSGLDSLTPSERRVAELAAEGLTNREIAQTLFVTPKTVEFHLASVYRKLAIGSRGQLPAALTDPSSGS